MEDREKKSFSIPSLIPPLASTPTFGKENERNIGTNDRKAKPLEVVKGSPGTMNAIRRPLGLRTPQSNNPNKRLRPLANNAGLSKDFPRASPLPSLTSSTKKRPVLRFGETTESLFCLTNENSEQHLQICKGIIDGPLSDDPSSWRQALDHATRHCESGSDLIRLHRRATLRFPVDRLQGEEYDDILAIWLSFAQVHAKFGSSDEARRTYRHIENQKVHLSASFYLEAAAFEKQYDKTKAAELIRKGISKRAEPLPALDEVLKKLEEELSKRSTPLQRALDPHFSPKRRKTEKEYSERNLGSIGGQSLTDDPDHEKEKSKSRIELGTASKAIQSQDPLFPKKRRSLKTNSSSLIGTSMVKPGSSFAKSIERPPGKPTISARQKLSVSRLSRKGLSRKGLSGKAKRVDPETSVLDGSESEQENEFATETSELTGKRELDLKGENKKLSVSKVKKLDLSYMWEWDPNARGKTFDSRQNPSVMEKIEEVSTSSGQSANGTTSSSEGTANSAAVDSNDQRIKSTEQKREPEKKERTLNPKTPSDVGSREGAVMSKREELVAKANLQFLPLVQEDNILRVNGSSYAKLGVIGKGGSCKVYRALSKKCSVVAIKKVKLQGMDRKAIEGYANEISLLKRLRGNPAIINMYDSEVDLERRFIYLVMELGEVDLNQVLQQRALSGASRSLNMNFIRLTWQQMLSAVHSIHEERIIHSDLKPANFLFVRGALKLIDFGIAKAIVNDDTTNIYRESHIGTLNYMSPEAIQDTGSGQNGPRMKIGRVSERKGLATTRILILSNLWNLNAGIGCVVSWMHSVRNGLWANAIRKTTLDPKASSYYQSKARN